MANSHFGEIGDIWKHLPLAEILAVEQPSRYWESHAGSASYPLSRSWQREYGIYYVLDHVSSSPALAASRYHALVTAAPSVDGYPASYPGSSTLAMSLFGRSVSEYVLCDLDPDSIASLQRAAQSAGIADLAWCIQDDGLATLWERAAATADEEAAKTLVHIDPFQPYAADGRSGLSAIDLCCELAGRGYRVVYWYGLELPEERGWAWRVIAPRLAGSVRSLWLGEISLTVLEGPDLPPNPGVRGCGVVCANISQPAINACQQLGNALVDVYGDASLPNGWLGALDFTEQQAPHVG